VFVVVVMRMKIPLFHELIYINYKTRSCKLWKGCLMNVSLQRVDGHPEINMKNRVVRILVMVMTISEMVVIVVEEVDVVVVMTGVQEVIMNEVAVCTLMMKMNFRRTLMRNLILILLQTEGGLDVIMIAVVMVVMMGNIIVVATGMIQIILLM
jgi:hypothetical protein